MAASPPTNSRSQTRRELEEHFEDQLDFLESYAGQFDAGKTNRAKPMAHTIRTLVHQTARSHSLLSQLGLEGRHFLSSAPHQNGANLHPECGLLAMGLTDVGLRYLSPLDQTRMEFLPLDDWWNMTVLDDKEGNLFSRRDLVLAMANKDGGSHVDPTIPIAYARFRDLGLGLTVGPGMKNGVYPERFAIRQIAHEVLKSLKCDYKKQPAPLEGQNAVILRGLRIEQGTQSTEPEMSSYLLTPATDTCGCRSGRSFADCHQQGASPFDHSSPI